MEGNGRGASAAGGESVKGGLVMFGLALLLSWIPLLGPFVGGFVGGRIVGDTGRAVGISIIPSILLGIVVVLVVSIFDLPLLGAVAGVAVVVWAVVEALPLVVGAAVGGATASTGRA